MTSAAREDGALLRNVVSTNNTGSRVWADTAYGSKKNEAWLAEHGRTSMIHDKKPKGRPMSDRTSKSNAKKSAVRAKVEHVFAHQKSIMGLIHHRPVCSHHRSPPRQDQNRIGKPCLQYEPFHLSRKARICRISASKMPTSKTNLV